MKKCVIFPASMKNVGLLYHFTELAIAFYKSFKDEQLIDFFLISEAGEQNPGLWDKIYNNIPKDHIFVFDDSTDFVPFVRDKLVSEKYSDVIYLTQGIMQFVNVIGLKRKHKKKLWLYTRLNSFKHGTKYRGPLTFFLSIIFKKYANFVNFQCESTARIFCNSMSLFRAGKAGIIPLGLSNERDISPNDLNLVNLLDDSDSQCVVYLANFHSHKRQRDLINFMSSFLENDENLHLILLGEGKCLEKCKNQAVELDLGRQIHFPGRLDRKYIPFVLRRADLAVVFSKVETFGHNILEPLFYGAPVVSSNVGIASDVIKDFRNGAVLCSSSHEEFKVKVEPFLIKRKQMTHTSSEEFVQSAYSWDAIVVQYKNIFEMIGKSS